MNKLILYIAFFTYLTAFSINVEAQLSYGIKLRSTPGNIGNRTSFVLIEEGNFTFQQYFDLSFDFCLDNLSGFGYICHLIEGSDEICLMYFPFGSTEYGYFDIVVKGKERLLRLPLSKNELNTNQWYNLKLSFFLDADSITLSIGDLSVTEHIKISDSYSPALVFGTYKTSVDLPTISIKDIVLQNHQQDVVLHYPLNEYIGSTASDNRGENEIEVSNPDWLAKEHYNWKFEHSIVTSPIANNCFIPEKNEIYLVGADSIVVYNIERNTFYTLKYANEFPLTPLHYDALYNPVKSTIDVYGFINGSGNQIDKRISSLDLATLKWAEPKFSNLLPEHCHHNALFVEGIEYPVVFGGYGYFKYFNEFIAYNSVIKKWQGIRFAGDKISPRFLASLSQKINQKYYLFGGYGNESGDQELGGLNYYDLFEIDTKNMRISKTWEMPKPENDFVGANTMVFDSNDSVFYVLGYAHHQPNTNLVLYRLDYRNNTYEIVSDSISSYSETIYSKKNLFYSKESGKLIAAIREDPGNEKTVFRYYSLHFPPVEHNEALGKSVNNSFLEARILLIILLVLVLLVSALLFIILKIKERNHQQKYSENKDSWAAEQLNNLIPTKNVILFFGEFLALNNKGQNISHMFSPRLRQLLLLIIMHQLNHAEGISSNQISLALWPDKEPVDSKNIRSVTINHLRKAIEDIAGVNLIHENKCWNISADNEVFLDLFHFKNAEKNRSFDYCDYNNPELQKFLSYTSRGNLGKQLGDEWIDNSKFEIESRVIDVLMKIISGCWKETPYTKLGLFATSSVLQIAPFNEAAIQYKLKFLSRMGKMTAANSVFESFVASYKKHFDQELAWSFQEVISNDV